ncbi:MAG: hypothetical protein AAFS07_16400 [Pseudomonadota bacterium]
MSSPQRTPSQVVRAAGVLFLLAGCAAETANPVPISQPGDEKLSCAALAEQREAGQAAAASLAGQDADTTSGNIAVGVVGAAVFWPMLFAMDLSNRAQIELRALQDRDATLARLEQGRGCR